jgi:hypothetical protein
MITFDQAFQDELQKIATSLEKRGYWQLVAGAVPSVGFAGYDTYKAWKEQMGEGERPEELKEKSYLTKYPTLGLTGTALVPMWAAGKGMEALGRKGDTGFHRAMSAGAGTAGAIASMDPVAALQKGVGL